MPAGSIFSGPITSSFDAMHFDENPFTCHCEEEDKKVHVFSVSQFYWLFSSDIVVVKALS